MDASSLDALRTEIDAIDGEVHGLIQRRATLVGRISAAKPAGGLSFRPGREAQVMRKRLATHAGAFPSAAVFRMWREMMSSFALMQSPALKIAVCRPADQPGYWDLARDHFGCQIPMVAHESPNQVLAAVRADAATIGVVPAPIETDTTPWWPLLARTEPEESGEDRALISLESATGLSRNRISAAFAKVGLPAFISALDQTVHGVHHYLLELPGVIAEGDKRLRELGAALELQSGSVAPIGAYAVPAVTRAA